MNEIIQQLGTDQKLIKQLGYCAVGRAIAELDLDNPGAQRVLEHSPEFSEAIYNAALESLKDLSVTDKYKDEEVKSTFTYPEGFTPKTISHQIKIIHEMFPDIRWGYFRPNEEQISVPKRAEAHYAIPKWQTIAPTYNEAVEKVLEALKKSRKDGFYNYRDGELGSEYLRQHQRTVTAFEKLAAEQPDHDILVVPAQFGLRHRGRSTRRAREVFQTNEFGLGAFAVGIMILTHPERFTKYEDLCVDCSGDEYAPCADGGFSGAPCFGWNDGGLRFGSHWTDAVCDRFGTVSGFGSEL